LLKKLLGAVVRRTGINYSCFRIFMLPLDESADSSVLPEGYRFEEVTSHDVATAADELLRKESWYGGEDALGFGVYRGTELVCIQWVWYGERYRTKRNFWPLGEAEAKSVQLVTIPSERGKGLATQVKLFSAGRLRKRGFSRLYSRIWWNNHAAIRVSQKAGWREIATVFELRIPGRSRPWRLVKRKWHQDAGWAADL
jgi:RimJ/RimL family protein N-acetyltransferase